MITHILSNYQIIILIVNRDNFFGSLVDSTAPPKDVSDSCVGFSENHFVLSHSDNITTVIYAETLKETPCDSVLSLLRVKIL